ncbi:MAG TPA: hypothetical protein VNF74_11030 [Terriglobales bacterium]|nr:hypothetical protein [Terriglobales bacterium]
MKLGVEKKGEVVALVVLLGLAAVLLWRNFFAGAPSAPTPAATVVPAAGAPVAPGLNLTQLDPRLHLDKLDQLRARQYTGSGRDLFHFGMAAALGPEAAGGALGNAGRGARVAPAPMPAPGPPPPPPIPLRFYGYAQASGMPEKIFLQLGDDTFVVSQGDTIAKRYVIENIGKVSVRVRDLMTQSVQELPLQQG